MINFVGFLEVLFFFFGKKCVIFFNMEINMDILWRRIKEKFYENVEL